MILYISRFRSFLTFRTWGLNLELMLEGRVRDSTLSKSWFRFPGLRFSKTRSTITSAMNASTLPLQINNHPYAAPEKISTHLYNAIQLRQQKSKFKRIFYLTKSILTKHTEAVHIGLKDFRCDNIPYVASHKLILTHHIKSVHIKVNDYQCNEYFYATSSNQ